MAGKIIINAERCKGCLLCISACPNDCIAVSDTANSMGYFPAEANNDNCTGCALCALVCPDVAIEVHRQQTKVIEQDQSGKRSASPKDMVIPGRGKVNVLQADKL